MIRGLGIAVLLCFFIGSGFGQLLGSHERAAFKHLRKKRWNKAELELRKALADDSSSALANYLFARYFFDRDNPSFQVDSAYQYALRSVTDFQSATLKDRERFRRYALDSARLIRLQEQLDSAAFESAKTANTEAEYIRFLDVHARARQTLEAIELRNAAAYQNATRENTYTAFLHYLTKYPESRYAPEARQKYDRLLYESLTRDKRLKTFENFLNEHPGTPFRKEVEQNIFELSTLSGDAPSYIAYLQRYPNASPYKKARNILFHILREQDDPTWPPFALDDSLRTIILLENSYLVPFLKNKKIGFLNKEGKEVLPPLLSEIADEYKCGNITDDVIRTPGSIIARNGSQVYSGPVDDVVDLGAGFLKIKSGNCYSILHKSGFFSNPCVQDARILGNRFIAFLKDSAWSIYSLSGRRLVDRTWHEVSLNGNILILKNKEFHLTTIEKLIHASENHQPLQLESFDDIRKLNTGLIWVRAKGYEGILDQTLSAVVPFDTHTLTSSFFGIVSKSSSGYSLHTWSGHTGSYFQKVVQHEPWLAVKKNNMWVLLDPQTFHRISPEYDTVRFEGPFPVGTNVDTLSVHFKTSIQLFTQPIVLTFVPGKDSTSFLIAEAKGQKTVYNNKGQKLFTTTVDHLQHAGGELFIVSKKDKRGVINSAGKTILPFEYDAIGSVNNNVLTLLKNAKFGLYHVVTHKLVKPQYDKNLLPYTNQLITAFKDGAFGFIRWDNKPDSRFEFEEIKYWNDSVALVKHGEWKLYDIKRKNFADRHLITDIKMIRDSPDEKLAIIKHENAYGVISNRNGVVIPISFTDLVNVGSVDEPLYFTEKHVAEASIYVVIYYDSQGKMVRRDIFEDPEDYEKIYCSDN